tara:strand:+ start:327 stop:680 length:354 start_codon:yes stop_codon:yes gene_type:complete
MAKQFDKSGGCLFTNDRATAANHPKFTGFITITRDDLRILVDDAKENKEIRMAFACFVKEGKNYLTIGAKTQRQDDAEKAAREAKKNNSGGGFDQSPQTPQSGPPPDSFGEKDPWEL